MAVKTGDRIRILEDSLQSADVKEGDILTVVGFAIPGIIEALADACIPSRTWWFSARREATGFEVVAE